MKIMAPYGKYENTFERERDGYLTLKGYHDNNHYVDGENILTRDQNIHLAPHQAYERLRTPFYGVYTTFNYKEGDKECVTAFRSDHGRDHNILNKIKIPRT